MNQYTAITGAATAAPEYDPNGNATAIDGQVLTWDEENRLATSTDGFRTTMYFYDGLGRRVEKSDYEAAVLKTTTRYVYDGWRVVEELDLSLGTSALSLVRSYTRGLDLSGSLEGAGGIGGLLAITLQPSVTGEFAPVSASYLYDGNGNVTGLLGDNGAELARYRYDPFGQRLSATGTWAELNPYQFSSKERDAATGFYYYGYRYYSPTTGRWLSRDPLEEQGGLNLYGFLGNDSGNSIDPLGLEKESWWQSAARKGWQAIKGVVQLPAKIGEQLMSLLDDCQKETIRKLLDFGQGFLDVLGLVPVVGEVFDGINALISLARGDYAAAAFSIAAMVPVAGWAATAAKHTLRFADDALKAGLRIGKTAGELAWRATKEAIPKALAFAKDVATKTFARIADAARAGGNTAACIGRTIQNNASRVFGTARLADNAPRGWKSWLPTWCFVAGTLIATADGGQPIEQVRPGDRVVTYEQQASATEVDPETWRKITLRLPNPDCPEDVVDLQLLRSPEWMESVGCAEGAQIWFDLDEGLKGVTGLKGVMN